MPPELSDAPQRFQLVLKLAAFALMVAAVGLPINTLYLTLLLVLAAIVLAAGRITRRGARWAVAAAVVAAVVAGKFVADVSRIEEGHNIFLPGGENNALVTGLPPDVYRAMAEDFEKASPPAARCKPSDGGCWVQSARPGRTYAFSYDGLYDTPAYSRRVTGIDFSDPLWLRLGFINEHAYNYHAHPGDIGRGERPRGLRRLVQPWRITMPFFVMYSFPQPFAGSELCWTGKVLWEDASGRFATLHHTDMACRTIAPGDAGKRIYGLSVAPGAPLAMTLKPTAKLRILQAFEPALASIAVLALLGLLVRWQPRTLVLPVTFVGLSAIVLALNDASFLGGVRPFDAGNDGLVYDGWSRTMVQLLLAGDVLGALKGMEPVFHFTPGSRYLRAVEHLVFGESYLGYVSLLLVLPFIVYALFRRFQSGRTALAFALAFIAVPLGAVFGSTYYNYVQYASQGFGDAAAAVLFLAGLIVLIGCTPRGPDARFPPALSAGLLFALALFVRPNFAVGAAVLLGGAGLAALWQGQFFRVAGLCLGFLPVFGMTLHNWYYGGVFVLFSGHFTLAEAMPAPPRAYVAALWELLRLDFGGAELRRTAFQVARMLTGPSESFLAVPFHAIGIAVLVRVAVARSYDGWLRLIAASALALHAPALFFIYSGRYHHMAWLLTLLVCAVWVRDEAWPWVARRSPGFARSVATHPAWARLARPVDALERTIAAR
ncbi:MAG: hypothetical protein FJX62_00665 [Alphaproteobacteria bacterium]|nr:hypothetical protein [Alphaproteobacteria bacterium]